MKIPVISIVLAISVLPTIAFAQTCKVTDPTSTPLNVRDDIYGKIIGKIPNGNIVTVLDYGEDNKGHPWVFVSYKLGKQPRQGWIYREFISCY